MLNLSQHLAKAAKQAQLEKDQQRQAKNNNVQLKPLRVGAPKKSKDCPTYSFVRMFSDNFYQASYPASKQEKEIELDTIEDIVNGRGKAKKLLQETSEKQKNVGAMIKSFKQSGFC